MSEYLAIVLEFYNLVLKYELEWYRIRELPKNELKILYAILKFGFNPKAVVPGRLKGPFYNDGTLPHMKLEYYSLHFKAVDQRGENDYFATGWLNEAARLVLGTRYGMSTKEEVTQRLAQEIENSTPFSPIELTKKGDRLSPFPLSASDVFSFFDEASARTIKQEEKLREGQLVGVHTDRKGCNGALIFKKVHTKQNALTCSLCTFQFFFPASVKTYGDLRRHNKSQ